MKFIADLHIHSKYSRATSKSLDLENIYISAQIKGIAVVGTGDFTHPGWFEDLSERLVPAEQGLYKLRADIAEICDREVPRICRAPVRFILQTEISNIYKKDGRTRKNHNLVYLPDFESAETFKKRLDVIGNIRSDGRPILGLDAKHLLEIALEVSPQAIFIPAHIWTPWFSLLGSKSGFDSLEACFEDLSDHIFAVETGLSSDPIMNRLVSGLDHLSLVSNSDAHSPSKLGREANLFNTELSYDGIRRSITKEDEGGLTGTIEFYPEEGKYHLDGHRKCKKRLWPEESREAGEICPVCGKPLTLGVLNRVMALADRKHDNDTERKDAFFHRVPLTDVLSEILRTGPLSKKVQRTYHALISKFGNEISILNNINTNDLEKSGVFLLPEAIERMRSGKMDVSPGFDGEFGKIQIFGSEEREKRLGQRSMFDIPRTSDDKKNLIDTKKKWIKKISIPEKVAGSVSFSSDIEKSKDSPISLNEAQQEAVTIPSGPILIVAGPGTGKTLTLTRRIAYLIKEKNIPSENVLAITFTNKAAREMEKRLGRLLGNGRKPPLTATFHGVCLQLLRETDRDVSVIDEKERSNLIKLAIQRTSLAGMDVTLTRDKIETAIATAKQQMQLPEDVHFSDASEGKVISKTYEIYNNFLKTQHLLDFEDLIFHVVSRLENDAVFRKACQSRFQYVFVDEYQDLNLAQYRMVRALSPPNKDLCVIGDPDQSIYGFRGSDHKYFLKFLDDYPTANTVFLNRNYRSTTIILDASYQVMKGHHAFPSMKKKRPVASAPSNTADSIHILEVSNERAEADAVSRTIEKMVGGAGYHAVDAGRIDRNELSNNIVFSDVAVLFRTAGQHRLVAESLTRCGIPYQVAGNNEKDDVSELRQLLSLFRVVDGSGHYGDFEYIISTWQPGIGKDTLLRFCHWGLENGFDLATAMYQVRRLPIPNLPRLRQEKIVDFVKILNGFTRQMTGLPFVEKIRYLLTHTRLERIRREDPVVSAACERLLKKIETGSFNPTSFFAHRALETDIDAISFDAQKVTLMTIHAAKGLEFPVVFIVGCEDDLIPFYRLEGGDTDISEERRLFFVAMTRAKHQLFLTWARQRSRFGKVINRSISPFVSNISDELICRQEPVYGKKRKQVQTQMKLF